MWLFNYRTLTKLIPVVFLLLITFLTFILKSVNKKVEKNENTKNNVEDEESTVVEVEIKDESQDESQEEAEDSVVLTPITQVEGLPPKAIKALEIERILTVEQLKEWTDEELLNLKGIGKKSLEKLRNFKK
jgi:DNA-directed RNA polymerase alpha subunit